MPFQQVGDIRVNYRTHVPQAGAGSMVTLITGIANDLSMWDRQILALKQKFRVLCYDLRGQGRTEATPPPYSIEQLQRDLIGLWDRLGVERSHVVGLGLGGGIAQAVAIDHPERVITLSACCCRATMDPAFAVMWHKLLGTVASGGIESIVEQTAQRWFSEELKAANPEVLDSVRAMIRGTSPEGYVGCIQAFLGLDLGGRIKSIRVPAQYVSGADDRLGGPPALMAGLAQQVKGARHVSVPRAAHIANVQNPEGFNRLLLEFLAMHEDG